MTRKEAFEAIRKVLFGEQKCKEAKTTDGVILQWGGDLTEGTSLNTVDETGNVMPCADGDFVLEDGTTISCVGGLVTKIAAPEEEEGEEMASEFEKAFAKHVEDFSAFMNRFAELEAKVASYESKFSEISNTINDTTKTVNDKFTAVVELVEKIAEEPAAGNQPPRNVVFKKEEKTKAWETYLNEIKNK